MSFSCEECAHFHYSRKWQRRVMEGKNVSTPHARSKKRPPEHHRSSFKPCACCDFEPRGCFKARTCAFGEIKQCTGTWFGVSLKLQSAAGICFEEPHPAQKIFAALARAGAGWRRLARAGGPGGGGFGRCSRAISEPGAGAG